MNTKACFCSTILLSLLTASLWTVTTVAQSQTQSPSPEASPLSLSIQQQRHLVQLGEQQQLPPAAQGYLWATLAAAYADTADLSNAEAAYNHALQLLRKDPAAKANYATAMDNLGALYLNFGRTADAGSTRRNALALRLEIGEPLGIASSRQHLAEVALAEHHFKDAEKQADAAYRSMLVNGEPDRSSLIAALVTLTYVRCMLHRCEQGILDAQEARRIAQESFQPDSLPWAHVYMALGFAQWKTGLATAADTSFQEGVRLMRLAYPAGSPVLRITLIDYRDYLRDTHQTPQQRTIEQQIASFPYNPQVSCTSCTVSTFSLR